MNWYCIRTATRQEAKAVEALRDMAAERGIQLDAYLPCETRWNHLTRVKAPKDVPLLPGYLFIRVEAEHLWRVDRVDGVHQVLGWGLRQSGRDAEKLVRFIGELREAQDQGLFDRTNRQRKTRRHDLKPGAKVKVRDGSFGGLAGEIIGLSGADRVKVLMTLFGRPTPVEFPAKDLDPQDAAPQRAA